MDQPPTLTPMHPITDTESLRRIYDEYGATVYRFCSQSLPTHLADEATQDVFVQAWRNRDRFDPERGTMIAWLIGIAKLRIIDLARHEQRHTKRRSELDSAELPKLGNVSVVDDQIDQLATKAVVADALRTLPDRQRSIVAMAYFDGLTHQEIADQTATPLGTVKSDIRRGLLSIRQHLGGADV